MVDRDDDDRGVRRHVAGDAVGAPRGGGDVPLRSAMFAMLMNVMGKAMIQGLFGDPDEAMDMADDLDMEDEGTRLRPVIGHSVSIPDQIEQLARLRDREIITGPQFEAKRDELLARM